MIDDRVKMQLECEKHDSCKTCPYNINDKKFRVNTAKNGYIYTVTCGIKLDWMQEYYGDKLEEVTDGI